jgi:putative aldouronate transport system permease protein
MKRGIRLHSAGFSLRGYKKVFDTANIWTGFRNTIFYVIIGTVFSMAITILGAGGCYGNLLSEN